MFEKPKTAVMTWDRRSLLIAAAAGLSGCTTWPDIRQWDVASGLAPYNDAHAHLFNASDLPVVKFLDHVFIRENFGELGPAAQGLIDLFIGVIKPLSISVDRENRAYRTLLEDPLEVTPDQFADAATKRTMEAVGNLALDNDPGKQALAQGLLDLASRVVAQYGGGERFIDIMATGDPRSLLRGSYKALAEEALADTALANAAMGLDPGSPPIVDAAIRALKWGVLMMQSRTSHLKRYLERQTPLTSRPVTIVNLLVDYDRWLDDGPMAASSHQKQIAFWGRVRSHYQKSADLRTFAGFCPLKEAYSRLGGGTSTHLKYLQAAFERGQIAGLKLYPPMGFRAIGNADRYWPDDFIAPDGVKDQIVADWRRAAGSATPLGPALDAALRDAYRWASANRIPILAHAGPSNAPGEGFEKNANPLYWIEVTREFPDLKIALGHFVFNAKKFVHDMETDNPNSNLWALQATRDLIRDKNGKKSNVFVDLAYTEELLTDQAVATDLPKRFFHQLKRYCLGDDTNRPDPDMSQILFGSDWIMLGMEPRHHDYLQILTKGMAAGGWTPIEIQRVCFENSRRWLGEAQRT
jgi:predicted TIM-barrel fold metal-dependent hydrolase